MIDLKNLIPYVAPITIIVNLAISLVIALELYRTAPERNNMGFNKYWHAFMLDGTLGNDKNLLQYDNDKGRYRLFLIYRAVSITCIATIGLCILVSLISG